MITKNRYMALMLTFVLVASMCNMSGDNTKAQDNLTFDVQGGLHITLSNTPYTLNLSTSQTFSSLIIDEDTTLILDNNNRSRYMNLTITGNATINGTLTADWHSGPIELNIGKNLTVFENGSIDLSASGTSARGGGYQGLDGYHGRGPGGGESYDAPQGGWQGVGGGASYGTYGTKGEYAGSYEANYGEKYGDSILSQWNNDSYTKTNPYSGVTYNQCVGGSSGAYGATQPGAGGGAIKIFASNINIKGSIETNGGNAPSGDCSGGGSGGTIWLNSSLLTVDGTISSVGGEGARLSNSYAIGGDGGKGRIYFQYDNKDVTGTINPSPVEKYPSTVITENATNVEHNEATLNGIGSSSFGSAIVWFEYGTTTDYGTNTSNVSMDGAYESYAIHISGLESDTEYHYRAVGNDTNTTMVGEDRTFTTISAFNITNPIIPQNNSMSTLCDFWQIDIGEKEGNAFDWWINTTPDVGTASGTDEYNGTKRINMNGLSGGETYTFSTQSGPEDRLAIKMNPGTEANISLDINYWEPSLGLGDHDATSSDTFTITNTGNIYVDVTINATDTSYWNIANVPGHDSLNISYIKSGGEGWTLLTNSPQNFIQDMAYDQSQSFGLQLWMPTTSSTASTQTAKVNLIATPK